MKSIGLLAILHCFLLSYASAQELQPLKKDFRPSVSITKAEVLSQSAERLNMSFDCQVKAGKKYSISGIALDRNKQPIAEVQATAQELAEGESLADLTFSFKQLNGKTYRNPQIETHYIQIYLNEKSRASELMESLNKNSDKGNASSSSLANALAIKYLYAFKKTWRVGGNKSMRVKVNLSPIGKARLLPRN